MQAAGRLLTMLGRTVACRMSFEECEGFVDDVCRAKNKDSRELPMLVLGNKNDRPADKQVRYFDSLCSGVRACVRACSI
jgi:hypothetical protein